MTIIYLNGLINSAAIRGARHGKSFVSRPCAVAHGYKHLNATRFRFVQYFLDAFFQFHEYTFWGRQYQNNSKPKIYLTGGKNRLGYKGRNSNS